MKHSGASLYAQRGGRGADHAERSVARGHTRTYAPGWTDAAVDALECVLKQKEQHLQSSRRQLVVQLLSNATMRMQLAPALTAASGADAAELVMHVLAYHAARLEGGDTASS